MRETRDRHPSYGVVSFSSRTGNPGQLFGSALPRHEAFITLNISQAELVREYSSDRYYSRAQDIVIEVDLSAAQFAELLTTMNVGCGTPCTIRRIHGKRVEDPPEVSQETKKIRTEFQREMHRHALNMKAEAEGLVALLEKKTLGKADRDTILAKFTAMLRGYQDVAPFVFDQFQEATEKIMFHAKAEVDAFVTHAAITKGMLVLQGEQQTDALPSGRASSRLKKAFRDGWEEGWNSSRNAHGGPYDAEDFDADWARSQTKREMEEGT